MDLAAFIAWVSAVAAGGPATYLPHRRETPGQLDAVRGIPNITISPARLPAELVLAGARRPLEIFTLPSSTATTLPLVLEGTGSVIRTKAGPHANPGSRLMSEVVAIIPARGGSKGVPHKNLRRVGGVPLVARAIAAARRSGAVDRIVVTTDDREIAAVAREWGADVVERPPEISGDTATSESALLHALDDLAERGIDVGLVAFLQATSPFIDSTALAAGVRDVREGRFDSAFSATETYGFAWSRDAAPTRSRSGMTRRTARGGRTASPITSRPVPSTSSAPPPSARQVTASSAASASSTCPTIRRSRSTRRPSSSAPARWRTSSTCRRRSTSTPS